MPRPYNKLRGLMREYEIDQPLLARKLLRSSRYVSDRLNNHGSWGLDECYKILALFDLPPEKLHEIFPENGRNEHRQEKAPRRVLRLVRGQG